MQPLADATLLEALAADTPIDEAVTTAAPIRTGTEAIRFVLCTCGGSDYIVREAFVTELQRIPTFTVVPGVPSWLRGVTNLRGDVLSVIDLRVFAGLEPTPPHTGRMLVVRLVDEEFAAGLLVDAVGRMVTVDADAVRAPVAPLDGPLAQYLEGLAVIDERTVGSLDLARLLRSPDVRLFDDPKQTRNRSCEAR